MIFSASIGAGHDGAAQELNRRLGERGFPVIRHDCLTMPPAGFGKTLRTANARQPRSAPRSWGLLLSAMSGPRMSSGAAGLAASLAASRMQAAIEPGVSAVVSTYPLASQVLGWLRRTDRLGAPIVAVMTDPSVHRLCVIKGADVHFAPGHAIAEQIHRMAAPAVAVSPIVSPAFWPVGDNAERYANRRLLGLSADERLTVVIAGSWGVGNVENTAADIAHTGLALPVVVCGRNQTLRRRLAGGGSAIALGWVDAMPTLLRSADVVVHNAGGLSSSDAMASGVPVISYRCLPGHGAANAAVLADAGLSRSPDRPAALAAELREAFYGDTRPAQRAALAASVDSSPDTADVTTVLTATRAELPSPTVVGLKAVAV